VGKNKNTIILNSYVDGIIRSLCIKHKVKYDLIQYIIFSEKKRVTQLKADIEQPNRHLRFSRRYLWRLLSCCFPFRVEESTL
jgi:hypothetical protein